MRILLSICLLLSATAIKAQQYVIEDYFRYLPELEYKVDSLFESLSDSQRVGQMIMPVGGKIGKPVSVLTTLIKNQMCGGILILKGTKAEYLNWQNSFETANTAAGGLPLMYSTDGEPSLLKWKLTDAVKVPNTNTLKSTKAVDSITRVISKELQGVNIHWNFAPPVDRAENSLMKNRSFGSNPDTIVKYAKAFNDASLDMGILPTIKHFPGHGLVSGDSHYGLVTIDGELKELSVYQRLIEMNSAPSIMIGHIAVINNEQYHTDSIPASCSHRIVTELLKDSLGYTGLVVTDAMNMGALNNMDNAALASVKAGNDVILMPPNEIDLFNDMLAEMAKDEAFQKQVYISVKKILRMKYCMGLIH